MFCTACGKELEAGNKFCGICGTAVVAAAMPEVAVSRRKASHKLTLLVIDDDPLFLESYLIKFEQEGFNVVLARSGNEGLELARRENPSVILLDILMPDMNGLDVLRKLKEDPKTMDIPVVMASIVNETAAMKQGLLLGAVRYITKENMTSVDVVGQVRDAAMSAGDGKRG